MFTFHRCDTCNCRLAGRGPTCPDCLSAIENATTGALQLVELCVGPRSLLELIRIAHGHYESYCRCLNAVIRRPQG